MGKTLNAICLFGLLIGGLLGSSAVINDQLKEEFENNKSTNFKVGKHNVTVKVDAVDKIIHTYTDNDILIIVPQTMDKDEATQQIEEIIMKIKRVRNIK